MIDLDKLRAVKTIISHDNCSDGLLSAILLHDALPTAEVRFIQYGTEAYRTLEPSPNMLFCDFSPLVPTTEVEVEGTKKRVYDQAVLQKWANSGALVLDHHDGAKDVVAAFGENGVFADAKAEPGVSGALLAFRHVWDPLMKAKYEEDERQDKHSNDGYPQERLRAETLAKVVGVRDTWQRQHAGWRIACEMNEVLSFYPQADWLALQGPFSYQNEGWWGERMKLGTLLWEKHEKGIQKAIKKSWRFTTPKGTRGVVFEGVRSSSDVAESLDKSADLIMGFDYEAETPEGGSTSRKAIFSTRSHTGYNCSLLAKFYGGGGHVAAAGFNVSLEESGNRSALARSLNPYSLAEALVREYEERQ